MSIGAEAGGISMEFFFSNSSLPMGPGDPINTILSSESWDFIISHRGCLCSRLNKSVQFSSGDSTSCAWTNSELPEVAAEAQKLRYRTSLTRCLDGLLYLIVSNP